MIFHTASDELYYSNFYDYYYKSIKLFYPECLFSLNFVGLDISKVKKENINFLLHDNIDKDQIQKKFNTEGRNTLGYYALSRWNSIPERNEHVVVSDVDVVAVKSLSKNYIDEIFKNHEVINITRRKPNGLEGGMAMMIIRKDIISKINEKANQVLSNPTLAWDSDVQVRTFIYKNFKVKEIPEMHVMGKKSNFKTLDDTIRSFVIYKGDRLKKIDTLNKVIKELER